MKRKPSWQVYHNLGEQFAHLIPANISYQKIGEHFGCRKQKVYHEAMVALGKVVFRLRKTVPDI